MAASEEYEHSEMLLYKAQVLLEGGSLPTALSALDRCQVLDSGLKIQDLRPKPSDMAVSTTPSEQLFPQGF